MWGILQLARYLIYLILLSWVEPLGQSAAHASGQPSHQKVRRALPTGCWGPEEITKQSVGQLMA